MTLRGLAERMTHRFVVTRRLPEPFADVRLAVSSEAGLRYLKPSLRDVDPTLLRLAEELVREGDVVWDVGANVGLFAFPAASQAGRAGRVVAVEADAYNLGLLRRSAAMQPKTSAAVDVLGTAVSDRPGVASFNIARRNRSTNALEGLGSTQMGGIRETLSVPTLSLDLIAERFPPPDVLKIDIEGAEALALAGAGDVLASRPKIVCEVSRRNAAVVAELLGGLGYRLFDGEQVAPRDEVEVPPFTLLALPC